MGMLDDVLMNDKLRAENKRLRDKEPDDDLTIAYLYGYNKGKEFSLAENKRLREALNTMPTCNLHFENKLAMDKWNDWKVKWFTPKGRIKKALKGDG